MPSLRDPAIDERFDDLVAQMRAARPRAPEALRARVASLPAPPPPRPALLPRLGRVLVPAVALAALVAAGVGGLAALDRAGSRGDAEQGAAGGPATATLRAAGGEEEAGSAGGDAAADSTLQAQAGTEAAAPAPDPTRLQAYVAELTVRVADADELGQATSEAIGTVRRLGGHVVLAQTGEADGEGTSTLVVRVPTARVQEALAAFAGLGAVARQQVRIDDLQAGVDARRDRIDRLELRLRTARLTEAQRRDLETQLLGERRALEADLRRARLARVSLTLTTEQAEAVPVPPGEIESAVRDAWHALDDVVAVLVWIAIVLGPFAALAVLAVVLERRRRRWADRRLLEGT